MKFRNRLGIVSTLVLAAVTANAQQDSTRTSPGATPPQAVAPAPDPHGQGARHPAATPKPAPGARTATRTVALPRQRAVPFDAVTLGVQHRVFHDFRDVHRVKLNEEFLLGDSDYSARVVQYLPDFQMDLASRRFFSLSAQPNNPAFKVVVRKGKAAQDTTWAFLNNPPHFGARSYFAFLVLKLELPGRAPLLPDTTSRLFKPGGGAPDARHAPAAPAATPTPPRPDTTRTP